MILWFVGPHSVASIHSHFNCRSNWLHFNDHQFTAGDSVYNVDRHWNLLGSGLDSAGKSFYSLLFRF
jgi:hypothetical protein